ncbi:MAG: TetR/AcrR family transcriptional regulator [Saprospiraceae bacterium]|nr:TetR/AcrR family transcriptional regulator [Saprospiraceae bacterium]|tara:strand:+ start:9709 stop:10308 length:600 start_codon:yes stop_codon:yes gene_type:complete
MEKERILQACTAEFMRLGVKSVSMDDISSILGISKKTLYQTVENKEDLVSQSIELFLHLERQLINEIASNANDAIHEMIQIGQHRVHTLRNMKPTIVHDLKKYYQSVWKRIKQFGDEEFGSILINNIEKGINEGYYRPEINPTIITKLFREKSWFIVDESNFSISDYKPDELMREHLLYHLHGILSEDGKAHLKNYELF